MSPPLFGVAWDDDDTLGKILETYAMSHIRTANDGPE